MNRSAHPETVLGHLPRRPLLPECVAWLRGRRARLCIVGMGNKTRFQGIQDMKKSKLLILRLISACIFLSTVALVAADPNVKYRWATPRKGLNLRAAPDQKAKLVATIPFLQKVELLEQKSGSAITISGVKGYWSRVKWEDKTGWAFDGFLAEAEFQAISISNLKSLKSGCLRETPTAHDAIACGQCGFINFEASGKFSHNGECGGKGTWKIQGNKIEAEECSVGTCIPRENNPPSDIANWCPTGMSPAEYAKKNTSCVKYEYSVNEESDFFEQYAKKAAKRNHGKMYFFKSR